jgi:hypothetical protein
LTGDAGCGRTGWEPHWIDAAEPAGQFYGGIEYMLMWGKEGPVGTNLITSGSFADAHPGALGQPGTTVLFGTGSELDYGATSGVRFTVGYWLDRMGTFGIEGTGLIMERRTTGASYTEDIGGSNVLGNPFYNTFLNRQDFDAIAYPGLYPGTTAVSSSSQLTGGEVNLTFNLYRDQCWSLDGYGGFRYLSLAESLSISSTTSATLFAPAAYLNTPVFPPDSVSVLDRFETYNHFYGANFGGRFDYYYGKLYTEIGGQIAFGDTREVLNIAGFSSVNSGPINGVASSVGGLYAGNTNGGHFIQDTFTVVPELDLKVGYQINCHVKVNAGYTFLYMSDVIRPGQQIDPNINPFKVPTFVEFGAATGGTNSPAPQFSTSDYWIQGVTFGLELSW